MFSLIRSFFYCVSIALSAMGSYSLSVNALPSSFDQFATPVFRSEIKEVYLWIDNAQDMLEVLRNDSSFAGAEEELLLAFKQSKFTEDEEKNSGIMDTLVSKELVKEILDMFSSSTIAIVQKGSIVLKLGGAWASPGSSMSYRKVYINDFKEEKKTLNNSTSFDVSLNYAVFPNFDSIADTELPLPLGRGYQPAFILSQNYMAVNSKPSPTYDHGLLKDLVTSEEKNEFLNKVRDESSLKSIKEFEKRIEELEEQDIELDNKIFDFIEQNSFDSSLMEKAVKQFQATGYDPWSYEGNLWVMKFIIHYGPTKGPELLYLLESQFKIRLASQKLEQELASRIFKNIAVSKIEKFFEEALDEIIEHEPDSFSEYNFFSYRNNITNQHRNTFSNLRSLSNSPYLLENAVRSFSFPDDLMEFTLMPTGVVLLPLNDFYAPLEVDDWIWARVSHSVLLYYDELIEKIEERGLNCQAFYFVNKLSVHSDFVTEFFSLNPDELDKSQNGSITFLGPSLKAVYDSDVYISDNPEAPLEVGDSNFAKYGFKELKAENRFSGTSLCRVKGSNIAAGFLEIENQNLSARSSQKDDLLTYKLQLVSKRRVQNR